MITGCGRINSLGNPLTVAAEAFELMGRDYNMKQLMSRLMQTMNIFSESHKTYRALQKHLNKQPVGYPSSITGVELRLLRDVFTLPEVAVALELDHKPQPVEAVLEKVKSKGISETVLQMMLDNMERNGAIFVKMVDDRKQYALHPFAVGIYEMKLVNMTPNFYIDSRKYMYQSFGMEFLTTSIPQMRVIPIQKSVDPGTSIATYDEIRETVARNEGRIAISDCICRKGRDMIGRPCEETQRLEVCMGFNDFHDIYTRNGFGRSISKEEAYEILEQNEKDGLVLMPSNCQEAQFVCSCCKCCCGSLEALSLLAKPAEFARSNFYAVLDRNECVGCGKCGKKCKMEAITMEDRNAVAINYDRCFGCGVCVGSCKSGALCLKKKDNEYTPPEDLDALYETILENKNGALRRTVKFVRGVGGF